MGEEGSSWRNRGQDKGESSLFLVHCDEATNRLERERERVLVVLQELISIGQSWMCQGKIHLVEMVYGGGGGQQFF